MWPMLSCTRVCLHLFSFAHSFTLMPHLLSQTQTPFAFALALDKNNLFAKYYDDAVPHRNGKI